jgi:hypothetical protein
MAECAVLTRWLYICIDTLFECSGSGGRKQDAARPIDGYAAIYPPVNRY